MKLNYNLTFKSWYEDGSGELAVGWYIDATEGFEGQPPQILRYGPLISKEIVDLCIKSHREATAKMIGNFKINPPTYHFGLGDLKIGKIMEDGTYGELKPLPAPDFKMFRSSEPHPPDFDGVINLKPPSVTFKIPLNDQTSRAIDRVFGGIDYEYTGDEDPAAGYDEVDGAAE